MGHDLRDRRVPGQRELRTQRFDIERLIDVNLERVRLDVAARRQSLQQRIDGHHPHALPRARQLRKRREPGGGDVGVGRETVVRQRLQIGKHAVAQLGACEKSDFLAQGLCVP